MVESACNAGDPGSIVERGKSFQGPKTGFCLALENELSEETHVLAKQEILLGRGTQAENSRVREPRRTAWVLR